MQPQLAVSILIDGGSMAENILSAITRAAEAALHVPLMPAPARGILPCAAYRFYPGESDGAMARSRFEVRVFAATPEEAVRELSALRRSLVSDGDSGALEDENGTILICETSEGGGAGYVRGCGMYFVKAGFDVSAHA